MDEILHTGHRIVGHDWVSKCVCWLLVNMSNVWQMKWTFNTIKFNQNTVSHTYKFMYNFWIRGVEWWWFNNVLMALLSHLFWYFIFYSFIWPSHINRKTFDRCINFQCRTIRISTSFISTCYLYILSNYGNFVFKK